MNSNLLVVEINIPNKLIKAPQGKILVKCAVGDEDDGYEGMTQQQIIKKLKNNYKDTLDSLIAYSGAEDYTIEDWLEEMGDDEDATQLQLSDEIKLTPNDVWIYCFLDTKFNENVVMDDLMYEVKPNIYLHRG